MLIKEAEINIFRKDLTETRYFLEMKMLIIIENIYIISKKRKEKVEDIKIVQES